MSALVLSGALLFSPPPLAALHAPSPVAGLTLEAPPLAAVTVEAFVPGQAAPTIQPPAPPPPAAQTPPENPAEGQQRDIVVTGRSAWEAPDPFANVNEKAFEVSIAVDSFVLAPIAKAYKDVIPKPVRDGAHNFLYNFREPVVFVNFLLQLKIGRALETAGRFAINTTVGVAGIFDMAKRKPFRLKRRSNGFANTFGFYGIKSGPYMYLPIAGPTTPRDLIGGALDRLLFPFVYGSRITKPAFALPFAGISMLDHRSDFDATYEQLRSAKDPYAETRDFYLQRRQNEIDELKGKGAKNSSGMSEAPTEPFVVKKRSGTTLGEEPAADAPETVPSPEAAPPATAPTPEPTPPAAVPPAPVTPLLTPQP